jgi:hypothetical protein
MQMYCAERLQMLWEKVEIVFYSLYFHPILSLPPLYTTVTKRDSQLLIQANSFHPLATLPSRFNLWQERSLLFFSYFPAAFRSQLRGVCPVHPLALAPRGSFSDKTGWGKFFMNVLN